MRRQRDRWLSMADVAELMGLKHQDLRERRRYVRRLLRRLEKRDGTKYTRRLGASGGKLYVAVSALEQLMPWDPGTLTAIRADLDQVGTRVKRVERRVEKHGADISKLKELAQYSAKINAIVVDLVGPKGTKKGAARTA